jgi:hypothetical protein
VPETLSDRSFDEFCEDRRNFYTMSSDSPSDTYGNYSLDNQESPLYTAKFDYQAQGEFDA